MAGFSFRWLIYALTVSGGVIAGASQLAPSPQSNTAHYLGAMSCSSSSCHGGAGDQRNQFIIWSQRDFHQRASLILTTPRSARIAETLKITTTDTRCTTCHSPSNAIASARLIDTGERDSGVSCESCHGPAERWLRSHTRRDYTYAMRVSAGMHDLHSFYVRANTCVACHQTLDGDIIAAGHPPLIFELCTQTAAEPPHWHDPPDSSLKAWLTGQAVALRELSWRARREGNKPDADTGAQISALTWLLGKVGASDHSLPAITDGEANSMVQETADQMAKHASRRNFENHYATQLLQILGSTATEFRESSSALQNVVFYRAKRLTLAVQALSGPIAPSAPGSAELNQMINDVSFLGTFNAAVFADHVSAWAIAAGAAKAGAGNTR